MLKKLGAYLKGYGVASVLTPLLIMGEVGIEVSIPFVISRVIDAVNVEGGNVELMYVVKLGLIMLALALCGLGFGGFAGRTAAVASVGFAKNLRNGLFEKVQDFSFSNIDKFSTPSLITRLTTDVNNVQMSFMMIIRTLVRSPLMLICATAFAVGINWKLALIFLAAIPILAIAIGVGGTIAYPRFVRMLKKYDLINAGVQEDLAGIRVVKTFVRENHESEKFRNASEELRRAQIRAEKLIVTATPLMMLIVYACIILILWIGGGYIVKGSMSVGEITSFLTYIMQIMMSLMMMAMVFVMIIMSRASAQRIVEVLDEKPDIVDGENADDTPPETGEINFRDVTFVYNGSSTPSLCNINLDIKSGETIGIIGGTGSSKSSLVQLIPRLYDATEGEVLVGGRNVKEYSLKSLRDSVAMVLQKNVLFSGTIRDNLKWGDENATDEEIENACKVACAYDFIMGFPEGFDTYLGQGGVNVSGGQKQRLCIARALLKKPKVMILDDSTSAVDTATDASIRRELREKLQGMTTIIIAQRIASVIDADRIAVLDEGKIADIGTHEELLSRCEIYKEVYESQFNAEEEDL